MSKKPNHLASLIDHQVAAKTTLPDTLAKTWHLYSQATLEVRDILVDCLPEEILTTCQVVGLTDDRLTLSVQSQTAANHMHYLQSDYLRLLSEQSITFAKLQKLRIIVSAMPSTQTNSAGDKSRLSKAQNSSKPCSNNGFSESTRQTIAHVANHVITDEALKKSLLKLAKED